MTKKQRIELLETRIAQLEFRLKTLETRPETYKPLSPATPFTPPYNPVSPFGPPNPQVFGPWITTQLHTNGKTDCSHTTDTYVYTTTATQERNRKLNKHF